MSQLSRFMRFGLLLLLAAVVTGGAQAAKVEAPIVIDAVTIGDGVAVVTGAVDATAQLEVNGKLVDVSDDGELRHIGRSRLRCARALPQRRAERIRHTQDPDRGARRERW